MSLNPSTFASASAPPCAKLTLNISAFNGNTTKVNVGRPSPKLFVHHSPVQPKTPHLNTAAAQPAARLLLPM